jgi:2-phosphoglycerate kinase
MDTSRSKIYFITGVNGAGKTTVIGPLKVLLDQDFEIHDFDERGVPDNADRKWRMDKTQYWIDLGVKNAQKNISTMICGFARPSEIKNNPLVKFILLDADRETIRKRLMNRYQTDESVKIIERVSGKTLEKFIFDNCDFSDILRTECKEYNVPIIDTDNLTPTEVANGIVTNLN